MAKEDRESKLAEWKPQPFLAVLEVTFHHFCHVLFIRTKFLGLVATIGEGTTQWCKYQKANLIGSHVRSHLPQCFQKVKLFLLALRELRIGGVYNIQLFILFHKQW